MALSFNRLPPVARMGLGGAFCTLLGVAYYFVLHADLATRVDRERARTGELQTELANTKIAQKSYLADRDELALRQQRQREWNKVLPESSDPASFLSALQAVSNLSGIDLKAWTPQDEVPQTFYAKSPMKLALQGRFHQLAKFIYEVGKQDRIINVENLELGEPKAEGEDILLKATCLATTFHLIKKAPPAGGKK